MPWLLVLLALPPLAATPLRSAPPGAPAVQPAVQPAAQATAPATAPAAAPAAGPGRDEALARARENAAFAREAFRRCARYLDGWLAHADPETGLVPRNLDKDRDLWVPKDSAADNFPYLLLSAALLAPATYETRVLPMLATEERLTSRVGALPDTWSFSRDAFSTPEPNLDAILFGAGEYAKDGLLAVTELLGPGPWTERMDALTADLLANGRFETAVGRLPLDSNELNGELLQVLCRGYWRTGDEAQLAAALRIGDYYLLGAAVPTRIGRRLRMRDHGGEIIAGLCELYLTTTHAAPERAALYRPVVQELVNRLLEVGRNDDGLFYEEIDPVSGDHVDGLADRFGYVLDGIYTLYLVDGVGAYRDAVRRVLTALPRRYQDYEWAGNDVEASAHAIEGALGLYRFEPLPGVAEWLHAEARALWSEQQPDGTIEGRHSDGDFARTSLMLGLWKTRGIRPVPWRADLALGAAEGEAGLVVSLVAEAPWDGRLLFDVPRHRVFARLPRDHPRTNAFPEWFPIEPDRTYRIEDLADGSLRTLPGERLAAGLAVELDAGRELRLLVR